MQAYFPSFPSLHNKPPTSINRWFSTTQNISLQWISNLNLNCAPSHSITIFNINWLFPMYVVIEYLSILKKCCRGSILIFHSFSLSPTSFQLRSFFSLSKEAKSFITQKSITLKCHEKRKFKEYIFMNQKSHSLSSTTTKR